LETNVRILAAALVLGLAPCAALACAPTSILDGAGASFNAKSALDGSSNCFAFVGLVDSTGANLTPSVAAMGDAIANPTTALFGSLNLGWDVTNTVWRRIQVDAGTGTVKVDVGGGTLPALTAGSALVGKVGIDQTTPGTTNGVQTLPGTGGGWTPKLLNAQSTTITTVKASAGKVGWLDCANPNSLEAYLQFLDNAAPTLGTTVPVMAIGFMPNQMKNIPFADVGVNFATAIKVAATTTATGSTAPTLALDCNVGFN
jgi:hypothetical protein